MSLSLKTAVADQKTTTEPDAKPYIGKQNDVVVEGGIYTPEVMWKIGLISGYAVSPDNKKIAYVVTYSSIEENLSHNVMHVMDADGKNDVLITTTTADEDSPQWIKGGTKIAFLSDVTGKDQIWEMNPDGSGRKQLSDFDGEIQGFRFAPDDSKVAFISQAPYIFHPENIYKGLDKATGLMAEDLMYKHWDHWLKTVPHPFYAPFDGDKTGTAIDILEGTRFESPLLPFGGIGEINWSNDSKILAYDCKKKAGTAYTLSTDSDIYLYNTETKQEVNICKLPGDADQNMGYDMSPAYSKSGKYIAWLRMEHDGYESDTNRLYVLDLETKKQWDGTARYDNDVNEFVWDDNDEIYFGSVSLGRTMIFHINLQGEYTQITEGDYDYVLIKTLGEKVIAIRRSIREPNDLYVIDPANHNGVVRITKENDHILNQFETGKVEERWVATPDGKQLQSWVIYPANFDPNKKYPALLMCMGGPQEACSQVWSNKWNFTLIGYEGYVMIMPNRRGCPGFGQAWKAEVSKDYGGLCMQDYLTAIDDLATEPYIDKERLGCIGASFGGYSVYWLAGHHEKRFKVFLAHDGMFNQEAMYLETDEMWFVNWDLGGAYWEKDNAIAQRSYANSPHRFVDKWDTPILCIHSSNDYRILISQGQAAFAAARLRGIEAQLLCFPDECHFVQKPQNSMLWQRVFFGWLNKYLK